VSKAALQTLRDAIKRRSFEPAYYIFGEDDYQKEDAVKQLQFAALDPATRDFNLEVRRGPDIDGEALSNLLSTPPMMAERRVVILRDVGGLKKEPRKVLEAYLGKPAPDLLLVLTAQAGGKPDKSLSDSAVALQFDELTGDRLPKWISHTAATVHGATITDGAVELLQSSVGNDLYQLLTELDKLASYVEGSTIDEGAVGAIVGVTPGETVGDFLDAIAGRDSGKALRMVPTILSQPKTSGVSIVMALATQMLAIGWGAARLGEGSTKGGLSQEFFGLLKDSGAFPGRPWGAASSAWTKASGGWEAADVHTALDILLDADTALKESRISSEEQLVSNLVLAICAAGSVSAD